MEGNASLCMISQSDIDKEYISTYTCFRNKIITRCNMPLTNHTYCTKLVTFQAPGTMLSTISTINDTDCLLPSVVYVRCIVGSLNHVNRHKTIRQQVSWFPVLATSLQLETRHSQCFNIFRHINRYGKP